MRVRYIYSACVAIETPDVKILSDPWFTPGVYDGSWFQYPPIEDPLGVIGAIDVIYVSHIHPDHYDATFLRRYVDAHPTVEILIGEQTPPFLPNKMRLDGFAPRVVRNHRIGETEILIVPNQAHRVNIDSAMAVRHGDLSIVNLNDNPYDQAQVDALLEFCPGGRPDFALLPYAGAGPYPQTYHFDDKASLDKAVETKRRQFLDLFARYIDALRPAKALPFAGKYWLGGRLAKLNALRGVPDAVEAQAEHPETALVLADGGRATYDLESGVASALRRERYDPDALAAYLDTLADLPYAYETELHFAEGRGLPLVPLLNTAVAATRKRVPLSESYWFCIRPGKFGRFLCFDVAGDGKVEVRDEVFDKTPRCEISIDDRYLFGLLTRLYHWNNATVGSHYFSRRLPDFYRREVYHFLDLLTV